MRLTDFFVPTSVVVDTRGHAAGERSPEKTSVGSASHSVDDEVLGCGVSIYIYFLQLLYLFGFFISRVF